MTLREALADYLRLRRRLGFEMPQDGRVCHGRGGELRQPYREGQEEQLNALGLIVNTIVLYNTIYTQRAIDHIAGSTGSEPRDEDVERLSPLGSDHITLTGRYRVLAPGTATRPRRLPRS